MAECLFLYFYEKVGNDMIIIRYLISKIGGERR